MLDLRCRDRWVKYFDECLPRCMGIFPPGRKWQEPDYTAGLAIGLPYEIDRLSGTRTAQGCGLRFGGSYIHQSPYVTYCNCKEPKTRELGDLLILCREMLPEGVERYNAALMQLKMVSNQSVDQWQLKMYTEWPLFSIGRRYDSSDAYDVVPKKPLSRAEYLYVEDVPSLKFSAKIPEAEMRCTCSGATPFSEFLADFIGGKVGGEIKPFARKSEDEWSRLIWEIILRHEHAKFKRCNISKLNSSATKERFARENGSFFEMQNFVINWDMQSLLVGGGADDYDEVGVRGILLITKGSAAFERKCCCDFQI